MTPWHRLRCWLGWHWRLKWADETVPPDYTPKFLCGWCQRRLR